MSQILKSYVEGWLNDHAIACENGLDADIGLRVKRWLYEAITPEQSTNHAALDALHERIGREIGDMVWEELTEAIDALKRL